MSRETLDSLVTDICTLTIMLHSQVVLGEESCDTQLLIVGTIRDMFKERPFSDNWLKRKLIIDGWWREDSIINGWQGKESLCVFMEKYP